MKVKINMAPVKWETCPPAGENGLVAKTGKLFCSLRLYIAGGGVWGVYYSSHTDEDDALVGKGQARNVEAAKAAAEKCYATECARIFREFARSAEVVFTEDDRLEKKMNAKSLFNDFVDALRPGEQFQTYGLRAYIDARSMAECGEHRLPMDQTLVRYIRERRALRHDVALADHNKSIYKKTGGTDE